MKISELLEQSQSTNEAFGRMAVKQMAQNAKPIANFVGQNLGKLKNIGAKPAGVITTGAKWIGRSAQLLTYFGLYTIYQDYNAAMERGRAKLKKGDWTQEEFDAFARNQKTLMVTQIATSVTFWAVMRIGTGFSLFALLLRKSDVPLAVAGGTAMAALGKSAQAALITALNTSTAREVIAKFTADTLLDDVGSEIHDQLMKLINAAKKAAGQQVDEPEPTTKPKPQQDAQPNSNKPSTIDPTGISRDAQGNRDFKSNPAFKNVY
jgi:hypothetical protein